MFYAHFVLSKKGPLARIWLAAHWDKKLTKAHVFETNICQSVDAIIQPKVKMALRTSGHLLLGVVRIYSRKAKYLLADCNEAFVKIKMAFRPGVVDLPEENREAAVATITLPETFHDFDSAMADLTDIEVHGQFSVNQSRPEEITMREDLGNITLVGDDGFGDMGFDDQNIIHDVPISDTLFKSSEAGGDNSSKQKRPEEDGPMDIDLPPPKDDFADTFAGGLFEEPPVPEVQPQIDAPPVDPTATQSDIAVSIEKAISDSQLPGGRPIDITQSTVIPDQTTLLPNDDEAFALEPLDITTIGTERKAKRRRKLIVDEAKSISSDLMKLQLSDAKEITTTLDLAPPTKKLMHWKETGGVEKLFALSGRSLVTKQINKFFDESLITRPMASEEELDTEQLVLEEDKEPEITAPPPAKMAKLSVDPIELPRNRRSRESKSIIEAPSLVEDPSRASIDPADSTLVQEPPSLVEDPLLAQQQSFDLPGLVPKSPAQNLDVPLNQLESADIPNISDLQNELPSMVDRRSPDQEDEVFNEMPDDNIYAAEQTAEAAEEIEEQRWNKRTTQLIHVLNRDFSAGESFVSFKQLVSRNNRKQVASKFYTLLVLKKHQSIEVHQSKPYGDILVTQGAKFATAV